MFTEALLGSNSAFALSGAEDLPEAACAGHGRLGWTKAHAGSTNRSVGCVYE